MSKTPAGETVAMVESVATFERALALVTSASWDQAITRADLVKACGSAKSAADLVERDTGVTIAESTMRAWSRIGRLLQTGQVKRSKDEREDARGVQDLATLVTTTGGGPALSAALKATSATRTAKGLAAAASEIRDASPASDLSKRQGPDPVQSVAGRVATMADNDPAALDAILATIRAAALERIAARASAE